MQDDPVIENINKVKQSETEIAYITWFRLPAMAWLRAHWLGQSEQLYALETITAKWNQTINDKKTWKTIINKENFKTGHQHENAQKFGASKQDD